MEKNEYIESVKEELEQLLSLENAEIYELSFSKAELKRYIAKLCETLKDFDGDIWQLANLAASIIFEGSPNSPPGSGIVAHFVLRMFREEINDVCKEYQS